MVYNRQNKRKQKQPITLDYSFRLWRNGEQYSCTMTAPRELPKYRLKEFFDKTFIGKTNNIDLESKNITNILGKEVSYYFNRIEA